VLPRLYAVCDADVCARAGWTLPDFAAACLDGGATLLQLRAKQMASRDFLDAAHAVVERAGASRAMVIINDRADIARLCGAAGVHVGQDDLSAADVRVVVGPTSIVGVSTHTGAQITTALDAAISYIAVGPVFGTGTKDTGYAPVGTALVGEAARLTAPRHMPVVAIGGITLDRAAAVVAAGAASVAVITDLLVEDDPAARVRAFLDRLSRV
jgi:thiamine-phosphate pyrophosphorylase